MGLALNKFWYGRLFPQTTFCVACWISTTLHSESECNGVAAGKDHTRTAMSQYSISISFHSLSYGGGYESQRQLPYCDPIIFFSWRIAKMFRGSWKMTIIIKIIHRRICTITEKKLKKINSKDYYENIDCMLNTHTKGYNLL